MIRYDENPSAVREAIRAEDPTWLDKAARRTAAINKQGGFAEKTSIWSQVKPVFMKLQCNKCIFCERQFENRKYGTIEFDLEHFRPKSSVATWPDRRRHQDIAYDFATGEAAAAGYYWLAYDPGNYAASCKVCNTTFKLNYFPIAGARGAVNDDTTALRAEEPFLCYPIGTTDADPEDLVTFALTVAVPAERANPVRRRRGQVIIDFFGLNKRDQLHTERARMICLFAPALQAQSEGRDNASDRQLIAGMKQPHLPHAACVRAFGRLWRSDRPTAERGFQKCREIVSGL
ncbi:MAG: hypothetical protein NT133_15525 [Alphaproteobacteria bacterium]|nr:hypothetical protein [Alphaproteobacteria bacterium]